ncbi:MAG TPA: CaiB/BaiF CoA-transferase family protein, partial [Acidimicrobiales bacterium]|nr:CaiB/BaiF CoA-transferase family protein [Acidimicrobiales bacterium]
MSGPLEGVRVLELAGLGAAPFAGMLLADLGADVLRLERGDPDASPETTWDLLNRSRPSVAVDLKNEAGRDLALELATSADALIEGFRPGVAERLGLGPVQVHARNPRLVYGRMTGWGQEGPLAQRAGHDINYIAVSGALWPVGRAGERPVPPLNYVGDFGGGALYLALGVVAALVHARATGVGQVVDAAMVDGSASMTAMTHSLMAAGFWREERGANILDSGAHYYDVYETSDGRYVAVGAI